MFFKAGNIGHDSLLSNGETSLRRAPAGRVGQGEAAYAVIVRPGGVDPSARSVGEPHRG